MVPIKFEMSGIEHSDHQESEKTEDEAEPAPTLLKRSESSSANFNLRKRKLKEFDSAMISKEAKEAQRLERERLNRIEKNKKELNAAVYAPIIAGSSSINLDDQGFDEPNQSDDDDDLLFVGEVIAKKKTDLVELGSSEDEVEEPSSIANVSDYASFRMNQFSQLRQSEQFRFRRRRRSADYDKTETGADGRLLVNAGKPDSDPEVFVTPHLTNVLQPHQIGGVKFMYDNIIESLDAFHKSSGFGCILAHSMGLGKSIQAITFVEIFIRITGQRRVLIICPVNVLQNWHNEFNRWLPKISAETALPIRQFELFVLGDSVKSMESRAQMIDNWHQSGGVLLMGYEMFRLLVHQCELLGEKGQRKKPSKKQPLRTVFDLADGLERISEEGRVKIVLKDELQKNIRRALLNPGPDLVICDEGHRIKNLNTEVSCALSSINTKRRIVLTGYPIQNNLMEYFCMVEFVRPSYLGSKRDFQLMFDKPIRNGLCTDSTKSDIKLAKQRIHVLCDMLRGFVQRRSQHLLKKILPESREFIVLLRKSELQHSLYRAFHHFACGQINAGESSFNPLKAFAICMKIVNHPDMLLAALKKHQLKSQFARVTNGCEGSNKTGLCQPSTSVQCPFDLGSSAIHSTTSITAFANDRAPIQPIKNPSPPIGEAPQPFANGNSSSLCSSGEPYYGVSGHQWQSNQFFAPPIQMQHRPPPLHPHYQQTFGQQFAPHQQHYNFFQQPPPFQPHPYQQQQQQNQLNSQFFPPVPPPQQQQYRHQFFTMDYANFDRCNQPTPRWYPSNSGNNNAGMVSNENLQQHFFNNPFDQQTSSTFDSSTHQTQPKKETAETNEQPQQQMDNLQQFCFDSVELPCVNDKGGQKNGGDRQKQTTAKKKQQLIGKGEECDLLSDEFLFEGGNSIDLEWAEPLLCNHATGIVEHSSKMFVAMAIISETIRRGEKLLLFSQSVVTLNLIEQFLKKHSGEPVGPDGEPVQFVRNETYCRLDGSTSGSDREKLINRFNQNANLWLFLISTRAGGLGVNLVSANRVIIFDVSWNPVHDAQAVCRIYRYGQRRRTYIYRLIMSNCMEKQVFNRQLSKHGLQKRVVDEQLIEANVTTKEVENLMDYDESLDVVSAAHRLEREMGEATEELDDDLLKMLIQTFPHNFFELPFLHESMMVEQEQDLSAEEKLEAQLLYEREKRGFNFPPQSYSANAIQSLSGANLPFPMGYHQHQRFPPKFGNPFATAFQRPWHSTPLPKHIELVSALEQQRKQQQTLASPVIIREQLTLPRVIPLIGEPTQHTLKAGDQITMFCSQKGVYFRTLDGIILDATKTQYGRIMIQRLREAPALVQRAIGPAEVIQIDD